MRTAFTLALFLAPGIAFAGQTIKTFIDTATGIVSYAVPVAVGFALLFFLWNMFQLITSLDDAEKRKQLRPRIIWGVVALFAIASVWGLVAILDDTFFNTGSAGGSGSDTLGSGGQGSVNNGVWTPPETGDEQMEQDPFRPDESGCSLWDRVTGNCNEVISI